MTRTASLMAVALMSGAAAALRSAEDNGGEAAGPTQTVTIQGFEFSIPARYAEGHVLNANEASAMNQLFAENVRNNAASKIKKAKAEAEEAGTEFSLDADRGDEAGSLRQEIQAYAETYEFGARVARASEPVDPIQKEAYRIATDLVLGKLRDANVKKKDLADGVFDETVAKIQAGEKVQKLAIKRVKEREALAAEDFDVSELATKEVETEGEGEGDANADETGDAA